ncbi:MAG TPA: putative sulfate exporter family transporter [Acidimicrobiia bacterium]|nr:putative sulfate exporter family transporter [Acidimicrobiia bacterium]
MRTRLPGISTAVVLAAAAIVLGRVLEPFSALIIALLLGFAAGNLAGPQLGLGPGFQFVARHLLRAAVVLLGARLSFGDLAAIGGPGLAVVAATVVATFFGAQLLGRLLGVSRNLSLLIGTGYAICGVSAVAAMNGVVGAEDEEVTYAIGLVTMAGSLSILILPLIARGLGMEPAAFGSWVGGAVHDVAQTVAAASTSPPPALEAAIVVKLTRVALLAPLVVAVAISRKRGDSAIGRQPPLPLFVIGFLALVAMQSLGLLSDPMTELIRSIEVAAFTIALVGVGGGVDISRLRSLGGRPLRLGLAAWVLVSAVALAAVALAT